MRTDPKNAKELARTEKMRQDVLDDVVAILEKKFANHNNPDNGLDANLDMAVFATRNSCSILKIMDATSINWALTQARQIVKNKAIEEQIHKINKHKINVRDDR